MIRRMIQRFASNIKTWPKANKAIVLGVIILGFYALIFVVPRPVQFSYAERTCVGSLTLLPGIHIATEADQFATSYEGGLSIGNVRLFATRTCFAPQAPPSPGSVYVASAPWGWYTFRSHYRVEVGATPRVLANKTLGAIAITKPLIYAISHADKTYSYAIKASDKTSGCTVEDTTIACNLAPLALPQGEEHEVTLTRNFRGGEALDLLTNTLRLLPAVTVIDSSMKDGQVAYDKPTRFTFSTDKSLVRASATLTQVDGATRVTIPTTVSVEGSAVAIAAPELSREKGFELALTSAEATDGSTIIEPRVLSFTTSGGPKVSGVSIGSSNVASNAQIVVTLDQAIADTVDIRTFAHISGVTATISKQGSQVIFSLSNAPRCVAFTLVVDKGITSGTNGLTSKEAWSHTSRINCRSTATIGYSVQGRPIIAYYYGSGSSSVLFTGGMHGSEPSGYSTMQAWASHLDTYAYKIPAGTQVVIVPNTNPDGIAIESRYNANGVNIDRNFATDDWQTDINTADGYKAGGGGSSPASEPETKALASLTASLRPRIEVSFHAQGRLVGANQVGNSASLGAAYAQTVGYTTMYGNAEELMGYAITGEYETWIGEKLGLPAILIELPSPSGNYFSSQQTAIWRLVNS